MPILATYLKLMNTVKSKRKYEQKIYYMMYKTYFEET